MPRKSYAFGTGDEAESDAFLEQVRGAQEEQVHATEMTDGTNARSWYTGGDLYADPKPQYNNCCSRVMVFAFSALLLLIGVAVVAVAAVQKQKKFLALCPRCAQMELAMFITGGVFCLFGVVGLIAAKTRVKVLAFFFVASLVLVLLAALAVGVATAVYETGVSNLDLHRLWATSVREDKGFICDVQGHLECSGFAHCCVVDHAGSAGSDGSGSDGVGCNVTAGVPPPAWYAQECEPTCDSVYRTPCETKLKDSVKKYFGVVLGSAGGVALLAIMMIVATVRMVLKAG